MRDDYRLAGKQLGRLEVEIESDLIEKLKKMETQTKFNVNELVNTALKRFISAHKDYLPKEGPQKKGA